MTAISRRLHPALPLFVIEAGDAAVLYAPGHLSRVRAADLPALARELEGPGTASALGRVVRELRAAAEAAQRALARRLDDPFAPQVLLLHLGHGGASEGACCGVPSAGRGRARAWLPEAAVASGARRVAETCARRGLPFALVLHFDSEQPAELELARDAIEVTRPVAAESGLPWSAQAVLAGVPSDAHARWLAREVGSIVLWCDDSPEPRDRPCPAPGGAAAVASLTAAAAAVRAEGGHVEARIAASPANVDRLGEIVAHAVATLGAEAVSIEPRHAGGGPGHGGFAAEDASRFVDRLLAAARVAGRLGVALSCPGVELGELHGPPCGVLRDVLHLLPDGSASACSLAADAGPCARPAILIGRWDAATGRLVVDELRIAALRRRAGALEGACRDCVGQSHCSRGCPGRCALADGEAPWDGFGCRVARLLTEAWVLEAAEATLDASSRRDRPRTTASGSDGGEAARLESLLRELSAVIDADEIRVAWRQARAYRPLDARGLPEPVWVRRGYEHEGEAAWGALGKLPAREQDRLSVYVHVPFCDVRCRFCDCYSVASPRVRRSSREAAFVATLLDQIDAWSALGCVEGRPVTTVHFGGGTPNHLQADDLDRILRALCGTLHTDARTEWALESTSRELSDPHLGWLLERGFRRLHVGVQTLEDGVRRTIGRHGHAEQVLGRLASALALGMTVSVDLVYGLPGETQAGWLDTLARLVATGVHGISLYQLQVSARNQRFLAGQNALGRDALHEYVLFQCAEQVLLRAGFSKNHFTHFARGSDANLYYRHPTRGEDLLALGPTASGVLGGYYYRHAELDRYLDDRRGQGLEGGMTETPDETRLGPAMIELMSGIACPATLAAVGAGDLLDRWRVHGLVRPVAPPDRLALTGNGSWFVKAMLQEVEASSRAL